MVFRSKNKSTKAKSTKKSTTPKKSKNTFADSAYNISEGGRTILIVLFSALLIFIAYATKPYSYPPFDTTFMEEYTVHGVDVSSYQGDIDWNQLYKQGVSFAFIKATEGSSHVDEYFQENWENIYYTPIKRAAYHFTSFETPGITQAANYISQVDKRSEMLPPIIDIEFYGEYQDNPPSKSEVVSILIPLIEELEAHYGVEPIIYTNIYFYETYIKDTFKNPIWIADLSGSDKLPDGKDWDFLQYTFEGELEGYDPSQKYIDLNVFNGTRHELSNY